MILIVIVGCGVFWVSGRHIALTFECICTTQNRPHSAARRWHRSSAVNASEAPTAAKEERTEEAQALPTNVATTAAATSSSATVNEPVSRGRIRPRSAPANRRKSSTTLRTQPPTPPMPTTAGCKVENKGQPSVDELLRTHEIRRLQEDRMFARELESEMREIAAEYLAMVKDA